MAHRSNTITKVLFTLLIFGSIFYLSTESSKKNNKESLFSLNEALQDVRNSHSIPKLKELIRPGKLYPLKDQSGCQLVETSSVDTISYFGLRCNGITQMGMIKFSKNLKGNRPPKGFFKIIGFEKIGNKNFIMIALSNAQFAKKNSSRNFDTELEYDYQQSKIEKAGSKKGLKIVSEMNNPNLLYFKTIASDVNRRKEAPKYMEIFFDKTCPLHFLEVDESFYWDNTISYVFEISCVKGTPYALVKVPGNKQNKLVVSNQSGIIPNRGEKFLAKLQMRKITNEHAFWDKFQLYYE